MAGACDRVIRDDGGDALQCAPSDGGRRWARLRRGAGRRRAWRGRGARLRCAVAGSGAWWESGRKGSSGVIGEARDAGAAALTTRSRRALLFTPFSLLPPTFLLPPSPSDYSSSRTHRAADDVLMAFPYRSISLCASLLSALLNIVCALRILLSWRSLRWDFSGVDDTDTLPVNIDALHLLWGLLTLYFAAAATASTIGFVGIARVRSRWICTDSLAHTRPQNLVTYVRFFRDYSIAEFLFMLLSATFISYLSFSPSSSSLRTSVCDELGRQPELLRDVAESGLDLENCEYWFERGVIVVIAMLLVFVIVRVSAGVVLRLGTAVRADAEVIGALHHRAFQVLQPTSAQGPWLSDVVHRFGTRLCSGDANAAHLPSSYAHIARVYRHAPVLASRERCGERRGG